MNEALKHIVRAAIPERYRAGLKKTVNRTRYFGFRYKCPFCESSVRTFLPFGLELPVLKEKRVIGGGHRLNARCPVCASIDRQRLIRVYLKNRLDVAHCSGKVLHVAPEGHLKAMLQAQTNLDYLTADLRPDRGMVKMDITDITFPANTFDAIVCSHVLEHVNDDHRAMAELFRVLKPGGWAILQVPMSLTLERT